jgi:hypothetical protein
MMFSALHVAVSLTASCNEITERIVLKLIQFNGEYEARRLSVSPLELIVVVLELFKLSSLP